MITVGDLQFGMDEYCYVLFMGGKITTGSVVKTREISVVTLFKRA